MARHLMVSAMRELEVKETAAVELMDTREQLRQLFVEFDLEGWDDDVYLADLVEKPLFRQLQARWDA